MSTDAIVMLKDDHKQILRAFRDFENAGDNAHKTKGKLVDEIIELLTVHTYIENEVMYPRVRELVPELEDDVLESYEEHHVADVLVMELAAMKPDDERFTAKTTVLIENVRHHIEEEEERVVPAGPGGARTQGPPGHRRRDGRSPQEGASHSGPAQRAEEDHRRRHHLSTPYANRHHGRHRECRHGAPAPPD